MKAGVFCLGTMLLCVLWPDKAPLSKGLLLVLNGLAVILALLPQHQHLFAYNLQALRQQQQVPPGDGAQGDGAQGDGARGDGAQGDGALASHL